MKRVVLVEKPSVARSIADALGGYRKGSDCFTKGTDVITWALGHLVENLMPQDYDPSLRSWRMDTLPFVPAVLRQRVIADRRERFAAVKRALDGASLVINGCDAGREGELIFRRVAAKAGYRGAVKRLWISSYTDAAIREGFKRLRPGVEYEGLYDSARVRSEGDWLVGLNGTRALTVHHGRSVLLSVGRVQTPVLSGLVRREQEIRAFVSEPYWLVEADFAMSGGARYRGRWFRELPRRSIEPKVGVAGASAEAAHEHRLSSEEAAKLLADSVRGRPAEVLEASTKPRQERPPQLFDLTALQRAAHGRFRLTARETLDTAQALYERRKLITYPRTDSRYLSADLVSSLPGRLRALAGGPLGEAASALAAKPPRPGRRVIDDAKVTDHHAIVVTEVSAAGLGLSRREAQVYELVARQIVAALSPDALWNHTRVITRVDARDDALFLTRGRILERAGWRAIIPPRGSDAPLPRIARGDRGAVRDVEVKREQTRPPPRYGEGTLLRFMETAGREVDDDALREAMKDHGLGTPATRAEIIEKLKRSGYIAARDKVLVPTPLGEELVRVVPLEELKSPEVTGRWEKRIREVQEGGVAASVFRDEVVSLTERLVEAIRRSAPQHTAIEAKARASGRDPTRSRGQSGAGRGRADRTKARKAGKSKARKKDGRRRSDAGGRLGEKTKRATRAAATKAEAGAGELGLCPRCREGRVVLGRRDFGCDRWRSGCRFVLRRAAPHARQLSEAQVRDLLSRGRTRPLVMKAGDQSFKARFVLEGEQLRVERL